MVGVGFRAVLLGEDGDAPPASRDVQGDAQARDPAANHLRLAQQVAPGGRAFGVDITDAMLEKARKTATKMGIENASFLRADLEDLPLADASVDWVTSNCVLNHANDKPRVWREIGRFVVSDIYAIEPIPEHYRRDPEAIAECWAGAIVRDEYLSAVVGAGLSGLEILEESTPYEKGKAKVASFTIAGTRPGESAKASKGAKRCCCC